MKINCGCGANHLPGFVNVDCDDRFDPDARVDLCDVPWPWETGSVDEVLFNHSLEHMGETVSGYFWLLRELYRVCAGGATVTIVVPHARHDDFLNDPTHVRAITADSLTLLSKRNCAEWRRLSASNTQLAEMLDVDFEIVWITNGLDPRFAHWAKDQAGLERMMLTSNNVIREVTIKLRVVKPAPQAP